MDIKKVIELVKIFDLNELSKIKSIEKTVNSEEYNKDVRKVNMELNRIKEDVLSFEKEYNIEIQKSGLELFIKNNKDFNRDFYTALMDEKNKDFKDIELFLKLYGIKKASDKVYDISHIIIEDNINDFRVNIDELKQKWSVELKTDDKEKIKNIISYLIWLEGEAYLPHQTFGPIRNFYYNHSNIEWTINNLFSK